MKTCCFAGNSNAGINITEDKSVSGLPALPGLIIQEKRIH